MNIISSHSIPFHTIFRVLLNGTLEENRLKDGSSIILAPYAPVLDVVVPSQDSSAMVASAGATNPDMTMTINVAYPVGINFNVTVDIGCDVNGLKQRISELLTLSKDYIYLIYRDR